MISIIIPAYNSADHISKCLDSIKDNTFKDYEIIIIDDASDDDTTDIIQKYLEDPRISLIRNIDNKGVSYCRNIGINKAKGEYICFIDSDDLVDKDYLKTLYETMIKDRCDWVACNYKKLNDGYTSEVPYVTIDTAVIIDNKELMKLIYYGYSGYNLSSCCMGVYRKSIIVDNDVYFDENISYGEDILFNQKLSRYIYRFKYIDSNLYIYRDPSSSAINIDMLIQLFVSIYKTDNELTIEMAKYIVTQYIKYLSDHVYILSDQDRHSSYKALYNKSRNKDISPVFRSIDKFVFRDFRLRVFKYIILHYKYELGYRLWRFVHISDT